MMTMAEQRHMAVVETSLRRIADALERLNTILGEGKDIAIYDNPKKGASDED